MDLNDNRTYETPLNSRYASDEMKFLFSSQKKILHLAPPVDRPG